MLAIMSPGRKTLQRTIKTVALAAVGLVTAAGVYVEAHRAPDQS
jgi:hypothetical protein